MSNKLGVVQYWVIKRPKNDRGRIIYGAELSATKDAMGQIFAGETLLINNGGTVEVEPTDPTGIRNGIKENGDFDQSLVDDAKYQPIIGQPWIQHSIHFGVDEALKSAKPLVIALGEDNVKICKILSHELGIKMS